MSEVKCDYKIHEVTDTFVLISDRNADGCSVTNDAEAVIAELNIVVGDLGPRAVYYRDSAGEYDELVHEDGVFRGFSPGVSLTDFFERLIKIKDTP